MSAVLVPENFVRRDVVASEEASLIQVIARAASDPAVDIDKMERLLQMQERVMLKSAEAAFNDAMTAAQSEMGRIATDADNPQTKSRYASYGKLDSVLRPIYTKHGFSLSYGTEQSALPDHVRILCTVAKGGFSRLYTMDMPNDGKGAKGGDVMTKTHASGAAVTYGMRYLLKMIFNVAIGENDNDGNGKGMDEGAEADFIASMEACTTTEELQKAFAAAYKAAEAMKDRATMKRFIAAKDVRKAALAKKGAV